VAFRDNNSEGSDSRGGRGGYGGNSAAAAAARKKKRGKKKMSFRKKRPPLTLTFDYRDLNNLLPFLTDEGKIVPARVSGLRAFQQRHLTTAVKRARQLAFISPISRDIIH
jgi:small subunit ribosomal protein S18